jgi:hypothetical protein
MARSEKTSLVGAPGSSSARLTMSGGVDGCCSLSPHGHGSGGDIAGKRSNDASIASSIHASPTSEKSSSIGQVRCASGGREGAQTVWCWTTRVAVQQEAECIVLVHSKVDVVLLHDFIMYLYK